ncbi:unnamed protein product [Heligmosomoides polygyrus]|uniref:Biogenesis of lysosome-related organelles complex 1 subunit 3 n=1 Tax=Heligmosomoides polygyrus TaxID=6339 RepID=A0A3P8APD1_HELPZ|nr:unnamed protein product [Heligmosomoides polygyrus]
MSRAAVVDGEASETDDEQHPTMSNRKRLLGAPRVIEGEAPETDDELGPSTFTSPQPNEASPVEVVIPVRARVHVDEKLEQRWRKLGEDALKVSVRRVQPTAKLVNDMENCLDNTIATVQNASAHIRHTLTVVYHLEDSVEALLDAAKLIPARFENTVKVMRLI